LDQPCASCGAARRALIRYLVRLYPVMKDPLVFLHTCRRYGLPYCWRSRDRSTDESGL